MIVLKILAAPVMVALSLLAAMVTFLFCVASAVCELGCIVLTLLSLILFVGGQTVGGIVFLVLDFLDSHGLPLEAVAVSCGPGSYTGLRIGVSMAKGICYGRGVKLIAVPTLELMAVPVLLGEHPEEEDALIVPMLDARRMEVYAEVLDRALKVVRPIQADIVDADTYKEYLDQHHVYFFGNGAAKCMETINHPNAHLVEGIEPLAKNMAPLAEKRFVEGKFEDVAYFVPFYLKDFVAKMPKKLL